MVQEILIKTCPICGKLFTTGVKGDRPRQSKYCSQDCLTEARKRESEATASERTKRYITLHPERVKEIQKRHMSTEKYKTTRSEYELRDYVKLMRWKKEVRRGVRERLSCLTAYGGEHPHCACCGEDHIEFMTLDHIRNDGSEHRKITGNGNLFYRWLIKKKFPSDVGIQILCWNCNEAKAHYGICPHEAERQIILTEKTTD